MNMAYHPKLGWMEMFSYFDISFDLHLCKLHIVIAPFFVRYGLFQASMAECFFLSS